MTIEKTINGETYTFNIIGRLDTTSSPELEKELEVMSGCKELILDMSALEYVSSAGLRVILKAQKMMNAAGSMKLIHVNETVAEVLDITGFTDILTIE